ncbi:hypothetical protein Trydic_g9407 [Trypoxylus dichotomus]
MKIEGLKFIGQGPRNNLRQETSVEQLYINIVRPTVTYVAIIWFQKVMQVTTRNTLDNLQRLACVCITGAMRTCQTAALEVVLDLTPLHIVVEGVAYAEIYRLTRAGTEGNEIARQRAWSSQVELPTFKSTER